MAFAMPAGMDAETFRGRVEGVCDWFEGLNPYDKKGSILEMEDQNFATTVGPDGTKVVAEGPDGRPVHKPLYCFAVSAKRYALFNRDAGEDIIIRKASAHGLGHLLAPYDVEDPDAPPRESEVKLWQEDVWRAIIGAALAGHPKRVTFDWHESLAAHAASHTASTPDLLRIFRHYNARRTYPSQVRPFNFMLWLFAKRPADRVWDDPAGMTPWNPRERPPKAASPTTVTRAMFLTISFSIAIRANRSPNPPFDPMPRSCAAITARPRLNFSAAAPPTSARFVGGMLRLARCTTSARKQTRSKRPRNSARTRTTSPCTARLR